jgi:hypothetical protein
MDATSDSQPSGGDGRTLRRFFFQVPNIVLELGLSPHELALYCAIRRTAGESGLCYRSGKNLAKLSGISTGKVSQAKRRLARPFLWLNLKPLISINERPSRHGGKAHHCISVVDIWKDNDHYFAVAFPDARSRDDVGVSASELASSISEVASSPDEIKNTPLIKIQEADATPSLSPSSRENEREAPEAILALWEFLCTLFKRDIVRPPNRREVNLMNRLLPVQKEELDRLKKWFAMEERAYDPREGIGHALARRPTSVRRLLEYWNDFNDVARHFLGE